VGNYTVIDRLQELIAPLAQQLGFDLIDITVQRGRFKSVIRILADKPQGGITVDECALMSRNVGMLLDEHQVLPGSFVLEVSSPGIDRPLLTEKDYRRIVGRTVRLFVETAAAPAEIRGTLVDVTEHSVVIRVGEQKEEFPFEKIKHAKQVV
jgi:ribosome maturation factor RimP